MKLPSLFLILCLSLLSMVAFAQKNTATVSGIVVDENEEPLSGVSVTILGRQNGVSTNSEGKFELKAIPGRAFAVVFSYTGFRSEQKNFLLSDGESETVRIRLIRGEQTLQEVIVRDQRDRREAGLIRPNPKTVLNLPSVTTGVESLIKVFVGSNNELTSQYSVRGGSYDENLIYVNDFEVFRPYLIRNGQQEGLSFINSELVRNINFYNGGFPARYGDKLSSVLDIQYRQPRKFGGSAYVGVLEQGLQLEGASNNQKWGFLIGARNRSNRNLLSRQETEGNYIPASSDLQGLLHYQMSKRWRAELFTNFSQSRFSLQPAFSQLTSSVFSPYFTSNLGLDIYFSGQEKDQYKTQMIGLSFLNQIRKDLRIKWMISRFENREEENIDIQGAYLFGDREFDQSEPEFGLITNPLGAGVFHQYARNNLRIRNWNLSQRGYLDRALHHIQWGISYDRTEIRDRLHEWEFQDSAGYNIPFQPDILALSKVIRSTANIDVDKFSAFLQDNWRVGDSARSVTLSTGVRIHYNTLNKQLLVSPRLGASWQPNWRRDIIFRAAVGAYHQPSFYREIRRYDGSINEDIKAQQSLQAVAGFDYSFTGFGRPMRWTLEAYYKHMWDVVPYDIDNVRLRYFGENNAKAYAMGLEMRLHGELVKDAESWISLGFMNTRENIKGDTYKEYTLDEFNNPIDSVTLEKGWVRRPTDRRITFGMFFQDYLATNKNLKMYLNLLYGSNLPYNIPNNVKYRNGLEIPSYIRVDIGFSALLLDSDRSRRRSHSPFLGFDNIWASLEVFNLIDRDNTISYLLIKDFSNTTYTMPQRLTPRLLNFKIVARW
ncbi:MAG: TonB-dependent receptor [Chitinophagaceae bacterium]